MKLLAALAVALVSVAAPAQAQLVMRNQLGLMIESDDLPGVNLTFGGSRTALAGTKGRSIDHIGFDVESLEEFVKGLEARGIKIEAPIRQVPNSKVKIAFLTDPYGTYIELTEGLAP